VQSNDVSLDLNGFALTSGGGAGALRGIDVPAVQSGLAVRNGTVRGWTGGGVAGGTATMLAEKLVLTGNTGAVGLSVGNGSVIKDCVSTSNGTGFFAPDRTEVVHCIATTNTGPGFDCTSFMSVIDSTSSRNGGNGIVVQTSSSVVRCNASRNDLSGIVTGSGCTVSQSTAGSNLSSGIVIGDDTSVRDCTARANSASGISGTTGDHIAGNTCEANVTGIAVTAPGGSGAEQSRIDSNVCNRNQVGISVSGVGNLIIRNHAGGNTSTSYSISPALLNRAGPMATSSGGTITETSPWANF
jgi:hypothetical protein